jgi:glutamate--glyoxylate aminotransferase
MLQGTGGECGLRGGYVEMNNIHPKTVEELYKICSINLSPNGVGQVAMSCLVNPPKPGSPSYQLHKDEREKELASLRRRARMVTDGFNSLEDVTCNFTEGAMYSFPQLKLPAKAIAAAKAAGKAPDVFYCLRLLEETGGLLLLISVDVACCAPFLAKCMRRLEKTGVLLLLFVLLAVLLDAAVCACACLRGK